MTKFKSPPQLRWNDEHRCWELIHPEISYSMFIDYSWNGESWWRSKYVCHMHGEWYEAITADEYSQRLAAIIEHEGAEAGLIWELKQDQVVHIPDYSRVFELGRHFQALMELGLLTLAVCLNGLPSKALDPEVAKLMDEAQRKERLADLEKDQSALEEGTRFERAFGDGNDVGG